MLSEDLPHLVKVEVKVRLEAPPKKNQLEWLQTAIHLAISEEVKKWPRDVATYVNVEGSN